MCVCVGGVVFCFIISSFPNHFSLQSLFSTATDFSKRNKG